MHRQHDFVLKTSSSLGSHGDLHKAPLPLTPGLPLPPPLLPLPPACLPSPRVLMGPACSARSAQGPSGHPPTCKPIAWPRALSCILHSHLQHLHLKLLTGNLNTRNTKFSGWVNVPRPTTRHLSSLDGSSQQAALSLYCTSSKMPGRFNTSLF